MFDNTTEVVVTAVPEKPLHEKAIYWGSSPSGNNKKFPTISDIYTRNLSEEPMPLSVFVSAVRNATARIWIVDEYFFTSGSKKIKTTIHVSDICNWFHKDLIATDIRILTGSHSEVTAEDLSLVSMQAEDINRSRPKRQTNCKIDIKTNLTSEDLNFIHDRFAIVDNELWHFGGTVGGYQKNVSAVSRGWCARETGAIEFFRLAWIKAGGSPDDVA
ncbi:hypothetical protein D3C79_367870 [compost metagenome]